MRRVARFVVVLSPSFDQWFNDCNEAMYWPAVGLYVFGLCSGWAWRAEVLVAVTRGDSRGWIYGRWMDIEVALLRLPVLAGPWLLPLIRAKLGSPRAAAAADYSYDRVMEKLGHLLDRPSPQSLWRRPPLEGAGGRAGRRTRRLAFPCRRYQGG